MSTVKQPAIHKMPFEGLTDGFTYGSKWNAFGMPYEGLYLYEQMECLPKAFGVPYGCLYL